MSTLGIIYSWLNWEEIAWIDYQHYYLIREVEFCEA
jgi:hypothetical protein